MFSQNERHHPRTQEPAEEREPRITLRFPPPREQVPWQLLSLENDDAQDSIHDQWFRAGDEIDAATPDVWSGPDSGAQRVARAGSLASDHLPAQFRASTRRRWLVAVVLLVLAGSIAVIAVALATRRAETRSVATIGSEPVPAAPSSGRGVQQTNANPTRRFEATQLAPVTQPSASATRPVWPATSDEPQHPAPSTSATPVLQVSTRPRPAEAQTPNRKQRRTSLVRPAEVDEGVPLNEIYVNSNGTLVDAQGKPLDWKPSRTTSPDAARDHRDMPSDAHEPLE